MNNENVEVNTATPADSKGEQKTFTQDDVNRIVQDRLAKDRAKASEELGKREQELKEKEFRLDSRQKLIDRGYPESIMDALNCSSTEAFDKALEIIDSLIKEKVTTEVLEQSKAQIVPRITSSLHNNGNIPFRGDEIRKAMNL